MHLAREELDRRLVALDEAMVVLRVEYPDRDALRIAFVTAAEGILAVAGTHRAHVSARLTAISVANGLDWPRARSG